MAESMLMKAKGINGTVELYADHIHIAREGLLSGFYNRSNRGLIALTDIRSVELHEAPAGLVGYLCFNHGTDLDGVEDFCVSFLKHQEHAFQTIHQKIEQQREAVRSKAAADNFVVEHSYQPF